MNPDEVFALLKRADPARRPDQEVVPMARHTNRSSGRWIRPTVIAAAAALALILAIGPLGLIGGTGDTQVVDTAPDTAATTVIPPPDESTIPPTTSAETTAATDTSASQLLVADGRAVVDLETAETLLDRPAVVAYDDLAGGVLYQTASSAYFGDLDGTDVWHVAAGQGEPLILMSQDGDARLRLMGVFEIEGRVTAIVVERRSPGVETAVETMYEIDVFGGDVRAVGQVGAWERGPAAISWDGSRYVMLSSAEGYTFLDTLDRNGESTPWTGSLPAECFDEPDCVRTAVATPDGSRLVLARGLLIDDLDLVLWDRQSDEEIWSVDLGPGALLGPPTISGDTIVVNRYVDGGGIGTAIIVDMATGESTTAESAGFVDVAGAEVATGG